jgi:DNA-binding GntR family transcriptional regulator
MTESTKADDIAVVIEEAIVSGELTPGSILRQEQLSEQYGVSRTPVREALRKLAALGLVSFEPNRGVRVRTLSHEDLREAFLVRAELEALVTEIAARRMTPEALIELEECEKRFARLTKEVRSHEPGGGRRSLMSEWMRANHAFHDVLYRTADVPYIESVSKAARRTFSGPAVWAPVDDELEALYARNQAEHRAIRAALEAGSIAGARKLAHEHVMHSFELLTTILEHVGADWAASAPRLT